MAFTGFEQHKGFWMMVVYPFYILWMNIYLYFHSSFGVEHVIYFMYGRIFFVYIVHVVSIGFKCGPSTYEGIWLVHVWINFFFMLNTFTILKFYKYNSSMNGISFASLICPYIWLIACIIPCP